MTDEEKTDKIAEDTFVNADPDAENVAEEEDSDEVESNKSDGEDQEEFAPDSIPEEAFDLEHGNRIEEEEHKHPWKGKTTSTKQFFSEELLYRYDILEDKERERVNGKFRIELDGDQPEVWSLEIRDEIEVVNESQEAEVVFNATHKDFLNIINGVLNPQLSILAEKIKINGDIKKALAFHRLLAPAAE